MLDNTEKQFVNDRHLILIVGGMLLCMLLAALWWNHYLPMQDYPQHLFMAEVASSYDEPKFDWQENYELRGGFGPYRATYIAQQFLGAMTDIEMGGKLLATFYILLVGLVAYRVFCDSDSDVAPWGVLLFFPLCFHPMYFYGFLNFTLSIPLLVLVLLQLKLIILAKPTWRKLAVQGLFVVALFMLHPFTLLVYLVLATASALWLGRISWGCFRGLVFALFAALLFVGWSSYDSAMTSSTGEGITLDSLNMKWWPVKWNLSFLAMTFTGLRFMQNPVWWVALVWSLLLLPLAAGLWHFRTQGSFTKYWFGLLFLMALAGYFVLPFSVVTDNRYTFFNVRMAPIFLFLLMPFIAGLPIGKKMGRLMALLCIILTLYSVNLHHRVSRELESFIPLFDKMEPNAAVLPLVGLAPSSIMDPFFYANFYSHFPFYYHVIKGGGVNPDMFAARLMPVGFRENKRPSRPSHRELHLWLKHRAQYDYVIARRVPDVVIKQLEQYGTFLDSAGPWALYKVNK